MNKRAVAVIIACFGTIFIAFSMRYSYGVILPEMLPSLGISKAEAGVIYASFFISYSVASPVLGLISDRYNVRVLIPVFVVLLGTGTLLMSYSSSVVEASLYFALAGIGSAACWTPVVALAQRWASDRRRGILLAVIDVGSSTGIIASGTIVPLVVIAYNWETGWVGLGCIAFLLAVLDFILIRDRPSEKSVSTPVTRRRPDEKSITRTYFDSIRNTRFWLIGMAYLFTGFSIIIPFTFLSTYAIQEKAFPYGSAAMLIMVIGIAAMVGKLVMGLISDRVGRIKMMAVCALLIMTGSIGITLQQGMVVLILFVCIFGWGYGAVWPLYAASSSDYFSKQVSGSIIGLWTLLLGIGCLVSPIIAGWVADISGTLTWGFYMAAGGGVLSLVLLLPILGIRTISSTER